MKSFILLFGFASLSVLQFGQSGKTSQLGNDGERGSYNSSRERGIHGGGGGISPRGGVSSKGRKTRPPPVGGGAGGGRAEGEWPPIANPAISMARLARITQNGAPVMIISDSDCRDVMFKDVRDIKADIQQISSSKSCRLGIIIKAKPELDENKIVAFTSSTKKLGGLQAISGELTADYNVQYLDQRENMLMFMIVDPVQAHWFFTKELGGCDIFIATSVRNPRSPLIIHANYNILSGQTQILNNLDMKSQKADKLVAMFAKDNYKLRVRIFMEPREIPDGYANYWERYKEEHPGVIYPGYSTIRNPPLGVLNSQQMQFIGHYQPTSGWRFFLKGEGNGVIEDVIVLSM